MGNVTLHQIAFICLLAAFIQPCLGQRIEDSRINWITNNSRELHENLALHLLYDALSIEEKQAFDEEIIEFLIAQQINLFQLEPPARIGLYFYVCEGPDGEPQLCPCTLFENYSTVRSSAGSQVYSFVTPKGMTMKVMGEGSRIRVKKYRFNKSGKSFTRYFLDSNQLPASISLDFTIKPRLRKLIGGEKRYSLSAYKDGQLKIDDKSS